MSANPIGARNSTAWLSPTLDLRGRVKRLFYRLVDYRSFLPLGLARATRPARVAATPALAWRSDAARPRSAPVSAASLFPSSGWCPRRTGAASQAPSAASQATSRSLSNCSPVIRYMSPRLLVVWCRRVRRQSDLDRFQLCRFLRKLSLLRKAFTEARRIAGEPLCGLAQPFPLAGQRGVEMIDCLIEPLDQHVRHCIRSPTNILCPLGELHDN